MKESVEDLIVKYTKEYQQLQKDANKEENIIESTSMASRAITLIDVILDLEKTI